MACLYTFMNDELGEVLVKCFPDRWIDVIILKKGSVIAIFSQSSHMDAVATGTQLPNLQTQFFFLFYLRNQRNHTAILFDNIAYPPLPPLHSSAGSFLWWYISNWRYRHFQFSLHISVWSYICSSHPVVIACFFLMQSLTGSVFLNWIIKIKKTKTKESWLMITLLHMGTCTFWKRYF